MLTINQIKPEPRTNLDSWNVWQNNMQSRCVSMVGRNNIRVNYEPTLWVLDGDSFYCEHQEVETDTVTKSSPNYITGDSDDYEAVVTVCRDCREVLEK